jgi:cellobiose-specific phosphotransferase system component IIC
MVAYGDGRRNIGLASALTVTDTSNQQLPYPGEKARGADIVVRRPWERYVFIGGLAGIVVVLIILGLVAGLHS